MGEKEGVKKENFIKWFSELNKDSIPIVGGKGANLAEIYNLKIPVPPGFVVTTDAYHYFVEKSGLQNRINEILSKIDPENTDELTKATTEIRKMMTDFEMPSELKEEIIEAYENLNVEENDNEETPLDILEKKENAFVAVRSSATAEDLADASFAGQQDTYLNINGNEELLESIKKCFASLFTARATYYRIKKGFKHEGVGLAVVVQKMINSDKSGVIFSQNPSFSSKDIIIEAVFGLGEGIVSGQITPDRYVVSRDLKILKKEISNKKIAIVKGEDSKKSEIKLSEEKSNAPTLSEFELHKLAEFAMKLENHYNKPQDIEFAIEGERICIVQTRAITTISDNVEESDRELEGEIILKGIPASPGIASGKIKVVHDLNELGKIEEGDVLVTKMTNPDMVVSMQKSSAIVTDEGGLTSHAAIVSREMGIPAIVGTREATKKLKDGEIITVDGSSGKVYQGKVAETKKKEIKPVTAETKAKVKVMVDLPSFAERASKTNLKSVGLLRMEGIIAESGKHPNHFLNQNKMKDYEEIIFNGVSQIAEYFDEIWVRTSDIRSDEFKNLEGAPKEVETNPMLGMHGIRFGLKYPDVLKAEMIALKRVAEKGKKIGLLLPQIISVDDVRKVKEFANEIQFSDAKIGVMVETPASVQIINELCDQGIDFISFGTNDLTQFTLAIDRGNEQVQDIYDEMNPAILYQLKHVIKVCKEKGVETSICGQAGSKKEMVEFLINEGIDSLSVNADVAAEIAEFISEIESKKQGTENQNNEQKVQENHEGDHDKNSEENTEKKESNEGVNIF